MQNLLVAKWLVWLSAGSGALLAAGLFATALSWGSSLFIAYTSVACAFFVAVLLKARVMLESQHRRRWFAIAALAAFLICTFGMIGGFIFFGAPLLVFTVFAIAPVRVDAWKAVPA